MSGWTIIYGRCFACGGYFGFNAEHVPSYRGPETGDVREPICRSCIERVNARRREEGREPWPVHSQAYEPEPA